MHLIQPNAYRTSSCKTAIKCPAAIESAIYNIQ